jgi:transposase InsO family protein
MAGATHELLADAARAHAAAGRGAQTAIVQQLADRLGVSMQTAYNRLREAATMSPRQRRKDAGDHTMSRNEAILVSSLIESSRRETGTGQLTIERAVQLLRGSGEIVAGRVDETTGEFMPLSVSAVSRAMRHYRVHPDQLAAPTPATRMKSPHPNWCWQIDASVSRQFYLADDGLKVMSLREFYRGKPGNFVKINDRRLWRYAVTDHASGYIEAMYVLGAESAANAVAMLIYAMTNRAEGCMHGVPVWLMTDPGSAMTSQIVKRFLSALGVKLQINEVGNARAKGQVENAHYLIERDFEASLKFREPVTSLEQINSLISRWSRFYNATAVHSRTGVTRRDGWLRISASQLIEAPPVNVLTALPTTEPKSCTVRDYSIRFRGKVYDVSGLDGVLNGGKLSVMINPFDAASVRVLLRGEDGRETHFLAPAREYDDYGFESNAAEICTEFRGVPETPVDAARKEIERLSMGVATDAEAAAALKHKRVPFAGRIDITKAWDAEIPQHIPRASTPSDVAGPGVLTPSPVVPIDRPRYEPRRWAFLESVVELKRRIEDRGGSWDKETHYARALARWPDGLTEDEFDAAVVQLMAPALRAISGGAA